MGIIFGFAPWIVYWVLVGNVPFRAAVLIAFAVAVAAYAAGRLTRSPGRTLETGAVATFLVLAVLALTMNQSFLGLLARAMRNGSV